MSAGGVLVTGAAKRIGRAVALHLAERGHDIAVHYNGSRAEADDTVARIRACGADAAAVPCDLADHADVATLVARAAEALGGPLEALVNNASLFEKDSIHDATQQSFDDHIAINLRAPMFLSQAFAAQLPSGRQGNIVNLIDMRVWKPTPGFVSYTLSKAGLDMLTKTMAMALAPAIRVNAIGPGPVLPNERQSEAQFRRQWESTLLKRGAEPEEIAAGVAFILSAPAMTGQMIALDGGQHMPWPPEPKEIHDLDG